MTKNVIFLDSVSCVIDSLTLNVFPLLKGNKNEWDTECGVYIDDMDDFWFMTLSYADSCIVNLLKKKK